MSTEPTDRAAPDDRSSTRRRLLQLIESADRPVDIAELATLTGLHANTLRGHLQLLVDLEQLDRAVESRSTPGRPRVLYSVRHTVGTDDPYKQLAGELASGIAHADGHGAAHSAGRHWGRRLRAEARIDDEAALDVPSVTALAAQGLEQLGFGTETEPLGDRLYLTRCPFGELARENPSVCQVHAGLLSGLFEELGSVVELERLDIYVRPDLCVAHLRTKGRAEVPATPAPTPVTEANHHDR